MESLFTAIFEVIKCLVPPLERRIDYVIHRRRNVNELTNEMEKLKRMRDDVQEQVEAARGRGEDIRTMVNDWLNSVGTIENEVSIFSRAIEHNEGCFQGGIVARYRIGKEAKEKFCAINVLESEGNFNNYVSYPPPPISIPPLVSIEYAATTDFEPFLSTLEAMNQIMEALKDENISSIGVYGMGGVGKTTLMKVVAKQVKREGIFDEVVLITVSQNPVLDKFQDEIAEILGLKLTETSGFVRAGLLMGALKKRKRILVILDDLWAQEELDKMEIPSGDDHRGCKVVISTRREVVCATMRTQAKVEVKVLSEQDAWHLFKKNAGEVVESPSVRKVAQEISNECQGLPIAIVTHGWALRDNKDQTVWEDTLGKLENSIFTDIEGMHAKVFTSIKLSYDYLESSEIKLFFLFCCFFPEDWNIHRDDLLKYGMGEGMFDDVDTLKKARARVHTIIRKLESSCLLLKGRFGNSVLMHDVIRDVGKFIASKADNGFIVKAGTSRNWPERENLKNCMRMSLMGNEIDKLPDQPQCPQLLTLSLNRIRLLREIPNSFFEGMGTLVNLDLSHSGIQSLPQSLSCLTNLRTLDLNYIHQLLDISLIGKLKKLEMISLRGCSIRKLSEEMGELTNLKLLDLRDNKSLETIPPNIISRLTKLEELYMGASFGGWEIEGAENGNNASLVEVASLTKLSVLHLYVENVKCLSTLIPTKNWENLTTFSIIVGEKGSYSLLDPIEFPSSMSLDFKEFSYRSADWVNALLGKTTKLELRCKHGLKNALQLEGGGFNNLKYLYMDKCFDVEYIISMVEEDVQQTVFNSLETLSLSNLYKLKGICHGPLPNGFFNKLTKLEVVWCRKLINPLLSSDLLARLQNLQVLVLQYCNVSEVFNFERLDEGYETTLSKLRELTLTLLPHMSTIWKGRIPIGSFHNLESVYVDGCHSLRYLFSPTMAQRLKQLEKLEILRCDTMVEIVEGTEIGTDACVLSTPVVFPNLTTLRISFCESLKHLLPMRLACGALQLEKIEIERLPNLSSMWSEVFPIDLPSLEQVYVRDCQNLKRIPIGVQSAPKLRAIYAEDRWFEGLEWDDEFAKLRLHSLLQMFSSYN